MVTGWEDMRPGKAWVRKFTKRWQDVVKVRKPTHIKRSRAKVSPETIREFFDHLEPNMEGIPATHVYNYDETNLRDDPAAEEAFFAGGSKYFEQVRNTSKVAFSVMFCCSAAGAMLPPMTVYKSANNAVYKTWCEDGPKGATYAATKSGWFNMDTFNQWFVDVFLVYIKTLPRDDVKVLIGDNLAAHLSPLVTELCEAHNIRYGNGTGTVTVTSFF